MTENKRFINVFGGQVIVLILFFLICNFVVHDETGITSKRVHKVSLDTGWEVTVGGETTYYDELPVFIKTSDDNTVWLSREIEDVTSDNNAIGLFSFQKEVHAYLDDEEVLVFENTSKAKSKMPGNSWLFIELEPEDAGKTLTLELHQCYGKGQVMMPVLYGGTVEGITNSYLKDKLPLICLSAVGVAVGAVLVILWMLVGKNLMLSEGMPWLGVFAIVRGIWSFLEANVYSFYGNHLLLWVWVSYICLKVTVFPFALFDNITFHSGKSKFLKVIAGIGLADTFITTLLQLFGIADFADTVAITNILIMVLGVYVVTSGMRTAYGVWKKKVRIHDEEKKTTYVVHTMFMFVLVVTSIVDVYRFYFTNSPDVALFSRVGYFVYVIAIVLAIMWDFARLVSIGKNAEYIREEASVDPMTKLYNRATFEKAIDGYTEKKCQNKGIIMFDLNNLKLYNDNMGHDMGDYYIKICSEVIRDLYGKYGSIFRIGGDEFCAIVEKMRETEFENVKKEMEKRVSDLRIPGCEIKMEIAAGYCRYEPECDQSLRDTMRRADEKMYENKALLKKEMYSGGRKMRKKLQKVVVSLLMVVMMSTMFVTQANAATYDSVSEKTVYNCVALGDSIVELSDSYVKDILDDVETQYEKFTYTNLGVSGWTSTDLLNALEKNTSMRSSVKGADFVVIDIGGNDIQQCILSQMAAGLGCSVSEIDSTMTTLLNQFNSATGYQKIYLGMQLLQKANSMHEKLYDNSVIQKSADSFKVNYTKILKIVKELAPNAKIYVANQYNPCMGSTTQYVGPVEVGNAYDIVELYDTKYNSIIANNSSGCTVVDLHAVITETEDILGAFESDHWNPHPSAKGYKKIIDAFLAKML